MVWWLRSADWYMLSVALQHWCLKWPKMGAFIGVNPSCWFSVVPWEAGKRWQRLSRGQHRTAVHRGYYCAASTLNTWFLALGFPGLHQGHGETCTTKPLIICVVGSCIGTCTSSHDPSLPLQYPYSNWLGICNETYAKKPIGNRAIHILSGCTGWFLAVLPKQWE